MVSTYTSPNFALQVDVFLHYPIAYGELAAAAQKLRQSGVDFLVSLKDHLIRAKQAIRPLRTIDERDIHDLQELIDREHRAR